MNLTKIQKNQSLITELHMGGGQRSPSKCKRQFPKNIYFRSIVKILHAKFGFKLKELYNELMPLTHIFIIGGLK